MLRNYVVKFFTRNSYTPHGIPGLDFLPFAQAICCRCPAAKDPASISVSRGDFDDPRRRHITTMFPSVFSRTRERNFPRVPSRMKYKYRSFLGLKLNFLSGERYLVMAGIA